MNTEARQAFRKRLEDLTETELLQWSFLVGLAVRIETELECYAALFMPECELEPAPDSQLAGIQLLLAGEVSRRSSAKTKTKTKTTLKRLHTGGENHADHEQNGHSNKS